MSTKELLNKAQFVIDSHGQKKAVILDYSLWEELITIIEDWEDAEEIKCLRAAKEEAISWEQAKAELRAEGIDV